ncbi:MAG TPA: carbohydrate ABC transporter permease [Candidatus Mediterraneibacter excrementigallinarum]|nr:carbohydrate ABC transporter permease [Candidatus Mediterraneibacter excrementigallinarum]
MVRVKSVLFKSMAYFIAIAGALVILLPFYITLITAFKTPEESAQNFFAFPKSLYLDNFKEVFAKAGYLKYFMNSVIVTVCSLILIYILVTMISYAIARSMKRHVYYKIIFGMIVLGMFVPFQVIMVPLVQFMGGLGLSNKFGLILLHVTYASMQAVFLLVNYIQNVPQDLEEAAYIDGCTTVQAYVKVVVPLLKPMTSTVLVLNALWIWNDFQMPLMILNKLPDTWTLPLFQYNFKSQYSFDYNMAFASYLIAMIPVLIAYITAQKHIVEGLTAGAVKS